MAKRKMTAVSLEEQETTINIDYFAKTVGVFTSKKEVYTKLLKEIGEPTKQSFEKKKIVGGVWKLPFTDRQQIKKILSITTLISDKKNTTP